MDLHINGEQQSVSADPDEDLLSALRGAGYTGVKRGCEGKGEGCGTCTVLIDGHAEFACHKTVSDVADAKIETISSLGTQENLHPIQEAFVDHFAVQCGFCTPGIIMQAKELLDANPSPTEEEIKKAIDTNYCRCTGYQRPVEAIMAAAEKMHTTSKSD